MSDLDVLNARKSAIIAEIAALPSIITVRNLPSYNVNDQSFDWNGYRTSLTAMRKALYDELQACREQIVIEGGDWTIEEIVTT